MLDSFSMMWGDTVICTYKLILQGYRHVILKDNEFVAEYPQCQGSGEWQKLKATQREIARNFPDARFVENGGR